MKATAAATLRRQTALPAHMHFIEYLRQIHISASQIDR